MRAPRKRVRSGMAVTGLVIVTLFALVAILAPLLSPYDPRALSGEPLEPPSAEHRLGTDGLGHDVLSQVIWGARASMLVGVAAASLAVLIAALVGIVAGLLGGIADAALMRLVDLFLAIPGVPFVIVVAAMAGPSRVLVVTLIAIALWPSEARILRSETLSLRSRGYVGAAGSFGARTVYTLRRHIVPAVGPLLVAGFIGAVSAAIAVEAGLAFLGIGDPLGVSWGTMLNQALSYQGLYIGEAWIWWVVPPGLAITLAVIGFAFIGVGLEPRMNPRWWRA